jgi:deoxycytidylate deaminase
MGNGNQQFTSSSFVLARYTTTGHLDTTFGSNGTVITTLSQSPISFVSALVLQRDGKIVAAGNTGTARQQGSYVDNFAVARYLAQ